MTQQVRRQAEERIALAEERTQAGGGRGGDPAARPSWPRPAGRWPARSTRTPPRGRLARLAVPFLADLAGVTLAGEHGQPWRTELAWADPGRPAAHARRLTGADGPRRRAARRGRAASWPRGRAERAGRPRRRRTRPAGRRRRSRSVRGRRCPLPARGRTLGALTLAFGPSGRRHDAGRPGPGRGPGRPGRHRPGQRPALPRRPARPTGGRTSSWRCSPTSCATRSPRSATPPRCCGWRGPTSPTSRWARDVIDRQVDAPGPAGGRPARRVADHPRQDPRCRPEPVDLAAVVQPGGRGEPAADRARAGHRLDGRRCPPSRCGSTATRPGWRRCWPTC